MIKNLIFDWSGTLADDLGMVLRASNRILEHYGKPTLTRDEFRLKFRLPYTEYYQETLPGVPLEELEAHFLRFSAEESGAVDLLPHARDFLEFCHREGKRMFVLSAIPEEHFMAQDARLGVSHFFEKTYLRVRDKAREIGRLIITHDLEPDETVLIGDMRHDMDTARAGNIRGYAVLTGYESAAVLEEAKPDLVARDLKALRRILEARRELPETEASPYREPPDEIRIAGLEVESRVGVPDEEIARPQKLRIWATLTTTDGLANLDDRIDKTVDYHAAAQMITAIAAAKPRRLIETLANEIAQQLLVKMPLLASVDLEIRKYILPETDHVAVKIRRVRE